MPDWNKLKTYNDDKRKSFEQLCYQLAREEYKHKGIFTPIDDSGGGDGVEFYLTFPNGDVWGWQAKFFGRLDKGSRKSQIKKSLQKANKIHPNLKKWFLCNKTNLTPNEDKWFYQNMVFQKYNGKNVLPKNHKVTLDHWGEDRFSELLRKYPGIDKYFFTEKMFDLDFFKKRYEAILPSISTKYNPILHIETDVDKEVYQLLGGIELAKIIEHYEAELNVKEFNNEYDKAIHEVLNAKLDTKYHIIEDKVKTLIGNKSLFIAQGLEILDETKQLLKVDFIPQIEKTIETLNGYSAKLLEYYEEYCNIRDCEELKCINWDTEDNEKDIQKKEEIKKTRNQLLAPFFVLRNYISPFRNIFHLLDRLQMHSLHISGEAGVGKTHLAFNIYEQWIKKGIPAILLFGDQFTKNSVLIEQMRQQIEIPSAWNPDEYLTALNMMGAVYKSKIPIIIDGLNESFDWKRIWGENLQKLEAKFVNYQHLVLITTYRSSYEDQLFPAKFFSFDNNDWGKKAEVRGFEHLTDKAVKKYFEYYKIELDVHSSNIKELSFPLYLKIFCETKNSERKTLKRVSFHDEDLFDVFDEYLVNANKNVCKYLKKDIRFNTRFISKKLNIIAQYLWINNSRSIPLELLTQAGFSEEELRAFIGESLLIDRDWEDDDVVKFTYDLLGSYIISKFLLGKDVNNLGDFIRSKEFSEKLLNKGNPLSDDILRCLTILLIKKNDIFLFEYLSSNISDKYSIGAIFEINTKYIEQHSAKIKLFLQEKFLDNYRNEIWKFSIKFGFKINHPLNFLFWHEILLQIPLPERDAVWAQTIARSDTAKNLVEDINHKYIDLSNRDNLEIIGIVFTWFLSTSNREIRDRTTRGLILVFQNKAEIFLSLLKKFLSVDDPYILQRLCAIALGVVMRSKPSKEIEKLILFVYGHFYIEKNLPVDILSRDYLNLIVGFGAKNLELSIEKNVIEESSNSDLNVDLVPTANDLKNKYGKISSIWGSLMHSHGAFLADFGNYIVSSAVRHWQNLKLEESPLITKERLEEEVINSLGSIQKELWDNLKTLQFSLNTIHFADLLNETDKNEITEVLEKREKLEKQIKTLIDNLISTFTEKQNDLYEKYMSYESVYGHLFKKNETFNAEIAQRWIYERVMHLGYSEKLHKSFDDSGGSSYIRSTNNIERTGKKYQWISYFELLARLSDNYRFKGDNYNEEMPFITPWALFVRDFEPTHISNDITQEEYNSIQDEENALLFLWNSLKSSEFIQNIKKLSRKKWVISSEDIPDYKNLIQVKDDSSEDWLILEGNYSCFEKKPDEKGWRQSPRKQAYHLLKSYFIRKENLNHTIEWAQKQHFMGRWMPESYDNHYLYFREYYWSDSYKQMNFQYNNNEDWNYVENKEMPYPMLVTTEQYRFSRDRDLSNRYAPACFMPCKILYEKLNLIWDEDLQGFTKEGELIAFDPVFKGKFKSAMMIKKKYLLEFLKNEKLEVFWTVLGEKLELSDTVNHRNEIDGVYYLNKDNEVEGEFKQEIINH